MSSHRIRIWDKDAIYFVTNRCFQARYLLRPDGRFNPLVIRWLRRTVRIFGLELYAAIIMGNHFHLIVRAPKKNLSDAMGYFQGNLARAVNKLRDREHTVFPDRFAAEPILDDEALLDKVRYLLNNPVKDHLVEAPGDWPGYTSWHQMVGQPSPHVTFLEEEEQTLPPLTRLPMWAELDDEAYAARVRALCQEQVDRCAEDREERGAAVTGADRIASRDWRDAPVAPKRSARKPLCHATELSDWERYRDRYRHTRGRYTVAVTLWVQGHDAVFPRGTIPPGHRQVSDGEEVKPSPVKRSA